MSVIPSLAERLRLQLGATKAPLVDLGIQTTAVFFEKELGEDALAWVSYLRGIDFHRPVEMTTLPKGKILIRHRPPSGREKPFLYFTESGESPMRTGTNFPQAAFERFVVSVPLRALRSTASSISFDHQDRVSRPGGAIQFILAVRNFGALVRQR